MNTALQQRLRTVLHPHEDAVLLVHPMWKWLNAETILPVVVGAFWTFIIYKISADAFAPAWREGQWGVLLFLLPFWLIGGGTLLSPLWKRYRVLHTVYVVTQKRAIVLQPSALLLRPETLTWWLDNQLVKEVTANPDGSGNIVFEYKRVHTKHGYKDVPVGFISVPEVDRVYSILKQQIETGNSPQQIGSEWAIAPAVNPPEPQASWKMMLVFVAIGLGIFLTGSFKSYESYQLMQHGVDTDATVVDMEYRKVKRKQREYPIVQFTDEQGRSHTVTSKQHTCDIEEGFTLPIRYLPHNPAEFYFPSQGAPHKKHLLLTAFGFICLCISSISCILRYRTAKKESTASSHESE